MNPAYEMPVCTSAEGARTIIENYKRLDDAVKENRMLTRRIVDFLSLRINEKETCKPNDGGPIDFSSHLADTLLAAEETGDMLYRAIAAIGLD